jgi:GntR family transcriptional repressor for pyruvate dehydrogenase complex
MSTGMEAIARQIGSLGEQVYGRLSAWLRERNFARGARLPSEAILAREMGVSRPILRQALIQLRAEGRIVARKGSGNYVADSGLPPVDSLSFGLLESIPDISNFLKFRCVVEGEAAALAATRRDPTDIAAIRHARVNLQRALRAGRSGLEEDIAFHLAIAAASGNRFFVLTMAALVEQTRFSIRLIQQLSPRPSSTRLTDVVSEHRLVEQAIAAGDARQARAGMTAHLQRGIVRLFRKPSTRGESQTLAGRPVGRASARRS